MSTTPSFWDRLADKYSRQPIGDEAAYQHKLEATQALLKPEMCLLEFGCGTGSTALTHAPLVKSIHAIDYSQNMIAIARDKAKQAGVNNVNFEVQSIDTLNVEDNSYDIVMGMSILHLLPNRLEVMAKIHRLLKPGGYFISSTVCTRDGNPIIPIVLPIMKALGKAPYVGQFTGEQLVTELEETGLSVDDHWRPKKSAALFVVAKKP